MIVYKTTNLINGKIYVGQDTKNNPKYLGSGTLLKKSIAKYGKENFRKEILESCVDKNLLDEREKYWILTLNSRDLKIGYNIANGGEGTTGLKHSAETKEKISKIHKGKKLSNEHIEIIRKYSKQRPKSKEFLEQQSCINKHWPIGSKHTDETRQKMSEYHKANPVRYWLGKKRPLDAIEKAKQSNRGFKHSAEHKKKISGKGNPFYGKQHSEEIRKQISESKKNKTPEQKLERYKKFFISRMGYEPTHEQLDFKLQQIKQRLQHGI